MGITNLHAGIGKDASDGAGIDIKVCSHKRKRVPGLVETNCHSCLLQAELWVALGESEAPDVLADCLASNTEALGELSDLRPGEVVDPETLDVLSV